MQLLLNLCFNMLSFVFSSFANITVPSWFLSLFSDILCFIKFANYFVPVSTFFSVVLFIVGFYPFMMLVSALLQLF